jgi:hypothetical protein
METLTELLVIKIAVISIFLFILIREIKDEKRCQEKVERYVISGLPENATINVKVILNKSKQVKKIL